ncbi:flippase-like domain-containing protein [Lacrimispora sp. NSJ-141]|uniref:Phosphatidylglycerol lysyltransferase n=1 Tax=Lientehia hominis TaxID=2897778 RepID=A0AAP2RJ60_9FIRM|nr:lysylphosphatidylglycerol synthase transmembrane domain-containing protein [Lientehia hominis]MCD2491843.1 flippase-like domain-containing protein [Lientehia hominis]
MSKTGTDKTEKKTGYGKGILLLLLLTAATVFVLLRGYRISDLWEALSQADGRWLLLGLSCMVFFVTCEAVNIRMIMGALGKKVSFRNCEQYAFIGFYFSSITPSSSGGQPMQVYYMKKDRISIADSSAAILFIVLVYQIAMLLFAGTMAVFHPAMAGEAAGHLKYLLLYGGLVNGLMAGFLAFIMLSKKTVTRILGWLVRLGASLHLIKNRDQAMEKVNAEIGEYHQSTMIMKGNPFLFLRVLAVTLLQMGALSSVPYCVYRALGYIGTGWGSVMTVQSILTLSASAVPSPGAVGAAEGGFLWAFQTIFPKEAVKTAMVVSRGISFYLFLILSFAVCAFVQIRVTRAAVRKKKSVDGQPGME